MTGWGASEEVIEATRASLDALFVSMRLEDARIPIAVCATDLRSGSRVEVTHGLAAPAVYASSALAGVLRPLPLENRLLVDGVYADNAPVDVARRMGAPVVIAVDPSQPAGETPVTNGLQAVMRAMEICHLTHAHLRVDSADVVIRPKFAGAVDLLDFSRRRECIAAGVRAARAAHTELERVLGGRPIGPYVGR
ncbi:MAG: hypothetical protein FJ207_02955 [Gemmatimonadetes bacterium]|nr:hypothetical protein [Gemmatimonadota bacterium]